ncbi:MAG TPA: PaaI family thioesterase [Acidimicrobiales bacterium]|nr:PaaI family thioesterase [Acidimicrobiales bacterium]
MSSAPPTPSLPDPSDPDLIGALNRLGAGFLPGLIGLQITRVEPGWVEAQLPIRPDHLAPNGFLHAATVVAVADTSCGYGCRMALPEGATGFTTIELKSNFLRTMTEGTLAATARLVHGGRTTQVWDSEVTDAADGRVLALFRCTQAVLWPRG